MSGLKESKSFKDRIRRIFTAIQEAKSSTKELICAGIQLTSSTALAAYMYENGTHRILPYMFSAITVAATYNYIKILRRNFSYIERRRKWSLCDFAIGTFTYSTGVYAFSECLKRHDMQWIPCLVLAASGYYFTISSINSLDRVVKKRPLLKCCQLMSKPALVACAATYLFYFRNHTEKWLKCLPLLVTAATGLKLADRGRFRFSTKYHGILLKAIEMCMGGCFLCTSCTVLAIYGSANNFNWRWAAFMGFWSLYGAFVAYNSLSWFQVCVEMEEPVFSCICGIISGPIVFVLACISFRCIDHPIRIPLFFVISGTGLALFGGSYMDLAYLVPVRQFLTYQHRVIAPVMTVYSSLYLGYFIYHVGWRISLLMMPVVAVGMYETFDAFRRWHNSQ